MSSGSIAIEISHQLRKLRLEALHNSDVKTIDPEAERVAVCFRSSAEAVFIIYCWWLLANAVYQKCKAFSKRHDFDVEGTVLSYQQNRHQLIINDKFTTQVIFVFV
ncbi:unnamed protein product [Clavelina lepadiformis]|uniref:Uncharacterized protein n=1 Tax=Clavelina lepadiformis TaxID=159417 RepID=A0ABP0G8Q2_CLALP